MKNLYNTIEIPHLINYNSFHITEAGFIKLKPFDLKYGSKFGHSICHHDNKLFLFGGFGEMTLDLSGKHMRHCSIEILDLNKKTIKVLNELIDSNNQIGKKFALSIFTTPLIFFCNR
jgi:hypothetical protein